VTVRSRRRQIILVSVVATAIVVALGFAGWSIIESGKSPGGFLMAHSISSTVDRTYYSGPLAYWVLTPRRHDLWGHDVIVLEFENDRLSRA
jgi:hypothetical protein